MNNTPMIHQRTNGTYFYECDTCWWVSPDYNHKAIAEYVQSIHEPCYLEQSENNA